MQSASYARGWTWEGIFVVGKRSNETFTLFWLMFHVARDESTRGVLMGVRRAYRSIK